MTYNSACRHLVSSTRIWKHCCMGVDPDPLHDDHRRRGQAVHELEGLPQGGLILPRTPEEQIEGEVKTSLPAVLGGVYDILYLKPLAVRPQYLC